MLSTSLRLLLKQINKGPSLIWSLRQLLLVPECELSVSRYVANEGKLIAIVSPEIAVPLLVRMRENTYGRDACIIGEVKAAPECIVAMVTGFGGTRIVDMLAGEQLPRVC